jgi:hypothetical protein
VSVNPEYRKNHQINATLHDFRSKTNQHLPH